MLHCIDCDNNYNNFVFIFFIFTNMLYSLSSYSGQFTLRDMYEQFQNIMKMGPFNQIIGELMTRACMYKYLCMYIHVRLLLYIIMWLFS